MSWLIDGSNLLGASREDDAAKRALVQELARFARARKTRVTCYFDGPEPASFGKHLGGVTIVFSGSRTADSLIAERVAGGREWKVVTSDRAVAQRVGGRRVQVWSAAQFRRELETLPAGEGALAEDWTAYFSDPKNRNVF